MRGRIYIIICSLIVVAGISGCGSRFDRVESARAGGGIVRVINKPSHIVFHAAVRVMHENGHELWEAKASEGRIVALSTFGRHAVFLTPLSSERTRIEISSDISASLAGLLSGKDGNFFTLLREQLVVYEKKEAIQESRLRKRKVDADLRNVYQKKKEDEEKPSEPTPTATPEPAGRFNRFKRR
ncbi:MAG: hypothetical protein HOC91_10235 [Nitrospinaceae bacterium]|nr:hypothetical protein [Nitrospinaceae bacterium]MBT3434745.1 hypothetical protein [Nitrospinaceae bacterium]MBT3820929.1 hypothetical protein [Nitrospinaceae bacterium]MBT4092517.1 hypothetical protein [Nitrospinaceae bacterium]MBT4430881.1 hypothetical protein [Nitrospinaceae bacterium]